VRVSILLLIAVSILLLPSPVVCLAATNFVLRALAATNFVVTVVRADSGRGGTTDSLILYAKISIRLGSCMCMLLRWLMDAGGR
jgi:hypothetical protein